MSDSIESKLDELLEISQQNARNMVVLYRRTTALALMMEALAEERQAPIPRVIRAEIDASLYPEEFENLARSDSDEFITRYGEDVLKVFQKNGLDGIGRLSDFAPSKKDKGSLN